jgi:outer membrane protein TolC
VRRISVDEAVKLALEQNLSLQVERLNPQIADLSVAQARAAWVPSFSTGLSAGSTRSPANSFLSGGQTLEDGRVSTSAAVSQLLPWGGSYSATWDGSRSTTTNLFSNFNPTLRSNVGFRIVQPLLRNFSIDNARQQLRVSAINREISDVQLRQTVVSTVRNVRHAYWDLSYAIASLEVGRQSLELAQRSLRETRARIEIGTTPPIDSVAAEAEVAQRQEAVIVAEAAVSQAEDRLRALILDPSTPDFWSIRFEPVGAAPFEVLTIDIDAAVRTSLEKRTDLLRARRNLESSDVDIRYFRNQTLPDVNVQLDYGLAGLGGSQFIRGQGFPGPVIGQTTRSFGSVLGDVLANEFPAWTLSLNVAYPIGASPAESNLARARLQYTQAQTDIRNLELQVTTQIRDAGRQVTTNLQRIDSTRASRQLQEQRLEAEEKKLAAGTSTSFQVFQSQRDLAQARTNELRAILDYNRSLVDFEALQEAALSGGGSVVVVGSGPVAPATNTTPGPITTTTSAQQGQF